MLNSILLVEDDPILGPLIQRILAARHFQVLHATTAAEALELWRNSSHAPSTAIVDFNLPGGINGKSLAMVLKADKPSLKLVMMTGGTLADDAHGGLEYVRLAKPFTPSELVALL